MEGQQGHRHGYKCENGFGQVLMHMANATTTTRPHMLFAIVVVMVDVIVLVYNGCCCHGGVGNVDVGVSFVCHRDHNYCDCVGSQSYKMMVNCLFYIYRKAKKREEYMIVLVYMNECGEYTDKQVLRVFVQFNQRLQQHRETHRDSIFKNHIYIQIKVKRKFGKVTAFTFNAPTI